VINDILTVSQVAQYLQVSDKTVRRLIANGKLTASKVGGRSWRVKKTDVEKYLDEHTNGKEQF